MNQPEDILSMGDLENLPDYTIFRKKTPALKRYPSSARKTLSRWYLSFVKNNNPKIKYKYWISVNGYLDNKTLIQSSPIVDIESPLVINTANTKYFLINNSDVLKNPPHSRFDLTELSKFTNGFPPDWQKIVAHQLTEIFGVSRIKSNGYENDKLLTPFDKLYNEVFSNEEFKNKEAETLSESTDYKNRPEISISENNKIENANNLNLENISEFYKSKFSASYISNSSRLNESVRSSLNNSQIEESLKSNSELDQLTIPSIKNQSNITIKSQMSNDDTVISSNKTNQPFEQKEDKNVTDENTATSNEDIEIISKSIINDGSALSNNISDIFLEDNINNYIKEKEEAAKTKTKPVSRISDPDISAISEKLLNSEAKSFDNVMNLINNQKINKVKKSFKPKKQNVKDQFLFNDIDFDKLLKKEKKVAEDKDEIKNKKEVFVDKDVPDFFINSSFNVPAKDTESLMKNKLEDSDQSTEDKNSKIEVGDLKIEDYLQDSHIIESILNLGNVIENSSFKPNDSDKVNLSIANKRMGIDKQDKVERKEDKVERKEDKLERKEDKVERKEDKVERKEDKSERKDDKSERKDDKVERKEDNVERKEIYSMLEEAMNSRIRRPYSYEETNLKKKLTPKKKKITTAESGKTDNLKDKELENVEDENIKKSTTSFVSEMEELKQKFKEDASTISQSELESDATALSQKTPTQPKKKKKGRSSLCMPKKPSLKKARKDN